MSPATGENIQFDILNDDLVVEFKTGTYYHVAGSLVNSWKSLI